MASAGAKTPLGQPFVELPQVDSTNIYAMELVQVGKAVHGTAVFAHDQTAGKGQQGKTWISEPHTNIILSLLLQPQPLHAGNAFALSTAIALGCHDLLKKYAGEESRIKWPNDLYWRDRKAGGILIENLIRGHEWQWSVAGMGININQTSFPEQQGRPVSLRQITGKRFDPVALARELCGYLQERWQQLQNGEAEALLEEYNRHLFLAGETVKLKKGSRVFQCRIQSVNQFGELCVEGAAEDRFRFGEVVWLL
ncbi:MAG: biotin--[acetyl-CoA-carboxylase] ligase [Chitinophagaceae bacterium]|nr:biotin--[acetyl-CoA-carboxylase] ligase [Chitinophagaceae bacterium]